MRIVELIPPLVQTISIFGVRELSAFPPNELASSVAQCARTRNIPARKFSEHQDSPTYKLFHIRLSLGFREIREETRERESPIVKSGKERERASHENAVTRIYSRDGTAVRRIPHSGLTIKMLAKTLNLDKTTLK